MVKEELVARSPVRIFEQSIGGGLKPGEIGLVAAPSGIGKTSVLVQIALDKLLQNKNVIHVSFTQHADYVLAWYENIFNEITKKNLENDLDIKNEIIKNRVLMNFNQEKLSTNQILRSLRALIVEGAFSAEELIIDGFDFSRMNRKDLLSVKQFAEELKLAVWYSCTVQESGYDSQNIPLIINEYQNDIAVVIILTPQDNYIELFVSKNRNNYEVKVPALHLNSRTLLIQKD
ncbi:hypothetical protein FACS1894172_01170 [Spirochaetia bacterium]|nr:hypothetical protein FACS1894164_06850 [Spirochaetia bacterium]GHU29635.1 hypothetical protein FACS1894172_01170 [Spirochaetia bacterium]